MKNCDSFVPMEEPSDTTRRRLPPTGGISSWPTSTPSSPAPIRPTPRSLRVVRLRFMATGLSLL